MHWSAPPEGAVVPVERKKARAPNQPYDADRIQAAVYARSVCRSWFDEPFTPQHREWVVQVSHRLRAARRATTCNRSHGIVAKCRHCSQRMHCGQAL